MAQNTNTTNPPAPTPPNQTAGLLPAAPLALAPAIALQPSPMGPNEGLKQPANPGTQESHQPWLQRADPQVRDGIQQKHGVPPVPQFDKYSSPTPDFTGETETTATSSNAPPGDSQSAQRSQPKPNKATGKRPAGKSSGSEPAQKENSNPVG